MKYQKKPLKIIIKNITVTFIILSIVTLAITGCSRSSNSTIQPDSTPQITQQEYEQRVMFCEEAEEAAIAPTIDQTIHQTIYDDFDDNGEMEAFVLIKSKYTKKESYFNLWYVAPKTIKQLRSDDYSSSISLINGTDYKHVLCNFNLGKYNRTIIYKVDNRKPTAIFRHTTFGAEAVNDSVKITVKDFERLKNPSIKQWLNAPESEHELRFDKATNQYINIDPANTNFDYKSHDKIIKNINEVYYTADKYTYIDIDKDGNNELLAQGWSNGIWQLKNNRLKLLSGGTFHKFTIYPEDSIVFNYQVHMGIGCEIYEKINRGKSKIIAYKGYEMLKKIINIKYEVNGKKATKAQYDAFTNTMKNKKVLYWNDLDWKKPA